MIFETASRHPNYGYFNVTNRLQTLTYPGMTANYTYFSNPQGKRLQKIKNQASASVLLSQFDYTYDTEGEVPHLDEELSQFGHATTSRPGLRLCGPAAHRALEEHFHQRTGQAIYLRLRSVERTGRWRALPPTQPAKLRQKEQACDVLKSIRRSILYFEFCNRRDEFAS
ncbi:MAG: hypothetical protein H0X34_07595 [Chthoniobacterales bacterium]|nr:hypothetical protein [Chthoniobacterales bacterium]